MKAQVFVCMLIFLLIPRPVHAQTWVSMGLDSFQIGFLYNGEPSGNVLFARGELIYAGTSKGLLKSLDGGATWQKVTVASNLPDSVVNALAVAPSDSQTVYVSIGYMSTGKLNSFLYKTIDGGVTWKVVLDSNVVSSANIADVKVSANDNNLILALHRAQGPGAGNLDRIYRSTDGGNSWSYTSAGFLTSSHGVQIVMGLDLVGGLMSYGTAETQFELPFYASTDGGSDWVTMSNIPDLAATQILVDSRDKQKIYVVGSSALIHVSGNGGIGWSVIASLTNNNPPYRRVYRLSQHPNFHNLFLATTSDSVWLSRDALSTWSTINNGLPNGNYYEVTVDSTNGLVYVAGEKGLFRLDAFTSISDGQTMIPSDFELSQNFPNPFNPTTTIRYSLPHRFQVRLAVYDLLGREVSRLVDGFVEAGNYSVVFNVEDLQSGVYFYSLSAGQFTEVKKMILLR